MGAQIYNKLILSYNEMSEKKSNITIKKNISLILNEIKLHYKIGTDAEFASFLGINAQTLSNWKARNSFDLELIHSKCVGINANWLLTGEGEMFIKSSNNNEEITFLKEKITLLESIIKDKEQIIIEKDKILNMLSDREHITDVNNKSQTG